MHMADLQASGMTWLVLTILSHPHHAGTGWHMTMSGLHILEPAGTIGRLRVYGSGSIECLPSTSKSLGSIPSTASTGLAANNCDRVTQKVETEGSVQGQLGLYKRWRLPWAT